MIIAPTEMSNCVNLTMDIIGDLLSKGKSNGGYIVKRTAKSDNATIIADNKTYFLRR